MTAFSFPRLASVAAAALLLPGCETTGDPNAGGYLGWSEAKARDRISVADSRLAVLDSANARPMADAGRLGEEAERGYQELISQGDIKLFQDGSLAYSEANARRLSRALGNLGASLLAHLSAKAGESFTENQLRKASSKKLLEAAPHLVGACLGGLWTAGSEHLRDNYIETALRLYFVWLEDDPVAIRTLRLIAVELVLEGNRDLQKIFKRLGKQEAIETLKAHYPEIEWELRAVEFFADLEDSARSARRG